MGHEIHYLTFKKDMPKEKIQSECDAIAEKYSDSGSGLYSAIRFSNQAPFADKEAAYNYLNRYANGSYEQAAVLYKMPMTFESKEVYKQRMKIEKIQQNYEDLNNKLHYNKDTVKSEFIGCKHCGSRIAVKYIRSNNCPVCDTDMRPKTVLDKLKKIAADERAADKELCELRRKAKIENAKPYSIVVDAWLVKIEYHV